jgi:uncharacterized protein (TIGR03437 family)
VPRRKPLTRLFVALINFAALISILAILPGVARAGVLCELCLIPSTLPAATVNTPYSTSLSANTEGGIPPYSYSAAVLPPGLRMDGAGNITGTPTTATTGLFSGSVTITDSSSPNQKVTVPIFIQVFPQPLTITTLTLPAGVVGVSYSQSISVAGGAPAYKWLIHSGSLTGTGLTLGQSTGVVSGTPSTSGLISFTVEVDDAQGTQAFQSLSIQVYPQLVISTPPSLHFGLTGTPYSLMLSTLAGTGGPSVTWSTDSTKLPPGLTLDANGSLHGTPTTVGSFSFPVQATDGISPATLNATLQVYGPVSITTSKLPDGLYKQTYGPVTLAATGGSSSFTWSATGLPAGVSVTGGVISGSPTVAGSFNPIVVSLLDSVTGQTASRSFSATITYPPLAISTAASLGEIAAGGSISVTLAATGGLPSYTWSTVSLPAGFSINSAGLLSGSAAQGGNLSLSLQVADSEAPPQAVSKTFSLNVLGVVPKTLQLGTTASLYSQTVTASGGSGSYTFTATGLPSGLTISTGGVIGGTAKSAGVTDFSVQVNDGSITTSGTFTITIVPPLAISTVPALSFGLAGQAYSVPLATQSGTGGPNVTWSIAPANTLPAGLTLDSSGLLHGTPTAAGSFSFALQANDGISPPAILNATLNVYGPLSITTTQLPKGNLQQTYGPVMMAASGGSGSFSWSATGLPSTLSISHDGIISGSLGAGGSFPVQIFLTDTVTSQKTSQSYTLTVGGYPPLSISVPSTTGTVVGGSISVNLTVSGGSPPYTWSPVSTLPAGFTLSSGGALSGTVSQAGNFGIAVQVTDAQPLSASTTVPINVLGLTTTSPLPDGSTTSTYSASFAAAGGTPPYMFVASGLPAGLSLSASGFLTGSVKQPTTASFTVQVTDKAGLTTSANYNLTIKAAGALTLSAPSLADGTVKVPYSATLSASGGNPPYTWSIQSGSLPPGISLSSTGVLSGTPTGFGTSSFTVQAIDGSGATVSAGVSIKINPPAFKITTLSPLPSGMVGADYPQQILGATGGVAPYTFSITDGSLPGLTLTNGVIAGVPTTAGDFSVTITAQDSMAATAQTVLALHVRPKSTDLILSNGTLSFSLTIGAISLPQSQSVSVASTDVTQTLGFDVQVGTGAGWLTASAGSTTPATLVVGLTSAALSLAASDTPYLGSVILTCTSTPCKGLTQSVTVSLAVNTAPGILTAVTDLLSFSSTSASATPSTQSIVIQNSGGGSLGFVSIKCQASWCTAGNPPSFLSAGASASIPVTVDPTGLPADYYRTTVDIVSSGGKVSIPVSLFVGQASQMLLAPGGAQFQMLQGGVPGNLNGSFLVSASGNSTMNWTATATSSPSWLILNTASGVSTGSAPGTVSFSIDPNMTPGLPAQPFYGTITVTSADANNSPQNFVVVMNVQTPDTPLVPDAQPAGLVFLVEAGATAPPQTVQIFASSDTPLGYQAAATTSSGGGWLSVTPTTGGVTSSAAPGQSQVSVDVSKLAPGVYYGGISYSLSSFAVRTVSVTLIVQAPVKAAAALQGIHSETTAPACAPSMLAPAQTGLVSNFSTPASWPTPLSIQLLNDCGKTVSNGQIVVTFTNGDPPLALGLANSTTGLYSGTWTPRNTGSQVSLNARATAPGLPAANLQISGRVVPNVAPVLAPNGTLHVFNPQVGAALAPGTIVQIYGTGLASAAAAASTIPLPTSLNGSSVIIGGVKAPLYFVSAGQINAQIPFELNAGQQYQVIANANGALTTPTTIQLAPVTPGLLAYADGGLIAQHVADGTLISDSSPAKPGEYVVLYVAGMGATTVPVQTGTGAPSDPLASASVTPTVTLNGASTHVLYGGLTPGLVGLYQIDLQIPADAPDGTLSLVVTQNAFGSNTTTLPVHQ